MPTFSIELPHWLYWSTLALFPLVAMILARRSATMRSNQRTLPIGYFILVTGGMLGLHRFYLKNLWGLAYLPLFLAILYANGQQRDARALVSNAANTVNQAERTIAREEPRLTEAEAELPALRADAAAAEAGSLDARRAEIRIRRAEERIEKSRERLEAARADLAEARPQLAEVEARRSFWSDTALYALLGIVAFVLIDAALLPRLTRRANEKIAAEAPQIPVVEQRIEAVEAAEVKGDEAHISRGGVTGAIDRLSFYAGEFVSYWAVIAVMVYYFEVVLRYVFNSPTIWAHEGMFLMFGMQYLIAGTYAMLTESHVRVDIFYAKFSARMKAIVDLVTSVFFFIFAGTLLVTGYIFAMDATRVGEISVQEWAIPYWPIKWAIFVGALLLALQGVSKILKDVSIVISGGDDGPPRPGAPGDADRTSMREAA